MQERGNLCNGELGPRDDEEFLDVVVDAAIEAAGRGERLDVELYLRSRPHLEKRIDEALQLCRDVAIRRAPADRIGGYEILREIGRGGMGTVYLARQVGLGREVALKVLPGTARFSERSRKRFLAEAQALGRLGHPHVVVIHDVIETADTCAFAMEWVDGKDLSKVIEAQRRGQGAQSLDIAQISDREEAPSSCGAWGVFVARICIEIARALSAAHRAGLLHRDVKPSNVLLRRDGTALLSDFGLVRDEDSSRLTEVGRFVGTLAYAAPEQIRGDAIDVRSDVYSLGVTLYHALGLALPFRGTTPEAMLHSIERGAVRRLHSMDATIPRDLATIVAKAMDVDPARRYASADELADDLERFLRHEPIVAVPDGLATRMWKFVRRNRRTVFAASLAAIVTTAIAAFAVAWYLDWKERPARAAALITKARQRLADPQSRVRAAYPQSLPTQLDDTERERGTRDAVALYDEAIGLVVQPERIHAERAAVATVVSGGEYAGSDERAAGIAAFLSGDSERALRCWRKATIDGPVDPLVEVFLGQRQLENGEFAAAYAHLLRVEREWPEAMFVRLDLADTALRLGDADAAEQWLAPLSFRDCRGSVSKRILLRLHSECAEARGNLELAEALDHILANRFGATTQSTLGHARRLARLGRPWEAVDVVYRMRDWNPRPPTWERDTREVLDAAAWTLTRAELAGWFGVGRDRDADPDLGKWLAVFEVDSANGKESATFDLEDSAPNPHGVSLRDLDRVERVSKMSRSLPTGVRRLARFIAAFPESDAIAIVSRIATMAPKTAAFAVVSMFVADALGQTEIYRWDGEASGAAFGYDVANAGDVDNDGYTDVIIGAMQENSNTGSATVRSGRTGAILHKWLGVAANDQFGHSVVGLGDLNGDGYDDVAVGMRGNENPANPGYVRVFSGQTGAVLYHFAGSAPAILLGTRIANVGDVNGDGTDDLGASSIQAFNEVKIFSGATGNVIHVIQGPSPGFLGTQMVRLGDLNGDGKEDFGLSDHLTNGHAGEIQVRSGANASIIYSILGSTPGTYFGVPMANVGDLNGDGKTDFATAASSGGGLGAVFVYSGEDGSLLDSRAGINAGAYFGNSITSVADVDHDGLNDLAIASFTDSTNGTNAGRVYIVSSATLDTISSIDGENAEDFFGHRVAGADLTNDGNIDLIVGAAFKDAGGVDDGSTYVYSLIDGCSTTLPHYTVGTTPRDVLLVDRDGDGDIDAVSANSGAASLSVLTNDGLGGFSGTPLTIALGVGDDPQSIVPQGNGLAVACPSTNRIRLLAPSGGSWTYSGQSLTPPGQRPVDLASGALHGTSAIDLVIALEGSFFGTGGGVAVTNPGGSLTLLPAPPGGFLSVKRVAVGDLDGDGDLDIVAGMTGTAFVAGPTANVLLYANDGSGTFSYAGALTGGGVPSGFALRDLDGDNDVDLMVVAQAVPPFATTSGLTVFKNNGTGALGPSRFTALSQLAAGSLPGDVVSLDLNSDSLAGFLSLEDVVVADTTGSTLKGFRSFGTTSFASTEDLEADDTPVALAAGDLNADGIPDLVEVNAGCDSLTVSLSTLNALAQKFGTGCAGTAGKVPAISAVGSPTFGNPSFGVKLTNGRAASFVFFGISLNYLNAPLGGGCSLFLTPPVSFFTTFTNATGQAQINFGIPTAVPPFVGLNAYFQYFVNDPVGGYSGFAFSDALRIRLGN